MAESISSIVKKIIDETPFLAEMMADGIISYTNFSEFILPRVEKAAGKSVSRAAIVMASRRYGEELRKGLPLKKVSGVNSEIVMKTNIFDVNLTLSDAFIGRLGRLYSVISVEKGDFLNVAFGNHEISLAVSEKHRGLVEELVAGEDVLSRMDNLVALTLIFSGDFLRTPGVVYEAVRRLAMESINVIEIVSTADEMTFVIKSEDSMKAFSVLQNFLKQD